jgi:secondary thiamine-phosphate synthase enzyme
MRIYHEKFQVQSAPRPTFDDVTTHVKEILSRSGIKNGTVLVYTGHTTCSIQIQEYSDGQSYNGNELIMQDLVNVLSKLVPTCQSEGQYLHPCFAHIDIARKERNEEPVWSLNTDAHLRSVIMGRSVTIPVIDGDIQLGEFGRIYFGDWDQVRARKRTVIVQIMGE